MPTANRLNWPFPQPLDANSTLMGGAKLAFFTSGTTNQANTYSDESLSTANNNPVVADASGRFGSIFLDPAISYKIQLSDSSDNLISTADPVDGSAYITSGISDTSTTSQLSISDSQVTVGTRFTTNGIDDQATDGVITIQDAQTDISGITEFSISSATGTLPPAYTGVEDFLLVRVEGPSNSSGDGQGKPVGISMRPWTDGSINAVTLVANPATAGNAPAGTFQVYCNNATDFNDGFNCLQVNHGAVTPGRDNAQTGGSASLRYSVVYAATGTINTSDAKEKTDLHSLSSSERRVACDLSKLIGIYQWLESIESKGENARRHIGVIAQQVYAIFDKHGLDGFAYGVLCKDNERWGVRYDQLAMWQNAGLGYRINDMQEEMQKEIDMLRVHTDECTARLENRIKSIEGN